MLLSVGLHLTVFAFALLGADWLPVRMFKAPPPIEVELVRLADKPEIPKPVEVKPEPKPEPPPEPPQKPPLAEPARAAPAPLPRPPEAAAEPAPTPKPKPEAQAAAVPLPKARPALPKSPAREDAKAFDPERISALINKMRKPEAKPEPQAQPPPPQAQHFAEMLSMSELDLIRRQFERCWSPPAGARDAASLVVKVRILLNPDGSLRAPPELVDRTRLNDGFWLAAAESALRAVRRCEPLRDLPAGKFERWRDIELTFDPKDIAG